MTTHSAGISLNAAAIRDEVEDVLKNGVQAHSLDKKTAQAILRTPDEELNTIILNSVDDAFWAAYDNVRSDVIAWLANDIRKANEGNPLFEDLDDNKQGALEELVHDAAAQLASNAINSGDELDFLMQICGWKATEIAAKLYPKE